MTETAIQVICIMVALDLVMFVGAWFNGTVKNNVPYWWVRRRIQAAIMPLFIVWSSFIVFIASNDLEVGDVTATLFLILSSLEGLKVRLYNTVTIPRLIRIAGLHNLVSLDEECYIRISAPPLRDLKQSVYVYGTDGKMIAKGNVNRI